MANDKPIAATLELVYVPDTYTETERQEGASWPLGSGYYDLVVLADGARVTLHRFKAGAIDKAFALAKESGYTPPEPPQQPPPPDTSALEDRLAALEAAQQQQPPPETPPTEQQ